MKYLLDTNIISALMKDNNQVKQKAYKAELEGREVFISAISYYEAKRGLLYAKATSKLKKFEKLCEKFNLVFLDSKDIFDIASKIYACLRKRGELIQDADILIASVAIHGNFVLVSDNIRHFRRIKGLKVENWLERENHP